MNLPLRSAVAFSFALSVAALFGGCSDELKKENSDLRARIEAAEKTRASLELELAKKAVELDGLKERFAAAKKNDEDSTQKLAGLRLENERLTKEVASAKEQFAALGKEVDEAKAKVAAIDRKRRDEDAKATVDFQAAVTYKNGDSKPVVNGGFFVLRKSMAEIFKESGLTAASEEDVASFFLQASEANESNIYDIIAPAIQRSRAATLKTNLSGAANAESLPPGDYWVSGFTVVSRQCIYWDYKVTLTSGKNQVYLDAANSAAIYPRYLR